MTSLSGALSKRLEAAAATGFVVPVRGARGRVQNNEAENIATAWRVSGTNSWSPTMAARACTNNTSGLRAGNTFRDNYVVPA
jgi:hypothetical protein